MSAPAGLQANPSDAKALTDTVQKLASAQAEIAKQLGELKGQADAARRTPFVRSGESSLTSRGFSFLKLIGVMAGRVDRDQAKVEVDLHNRLQKQCFDNLGYRKSEANTIVAPFGSEFLPQIGETDSAFAGEVREVVKAGISGYDPEQVLRMVKSVHGLRAKTLSWTDESAMGALVGPPLMGELIDLLRNREVFLKAGAQSVGLPPNGRFVYPRQTSGTSAYWVGESVAITDSAPATGDVVLTAKKLAALVKVPNELFRYASINAEAFLRMDLTKQMGLKLDKTLLDGTGSSNEPKGLINYAGIGSYTSAGTPSDGNHGYPIHPKDPASMVGTVEEANAEFKAFVMRPLLWTKIATTRWDTVSAGDQAGGFVFDFVRSLGYGAESSQDTVATLSGYPVFKSTQIANTRTRGSASNLTYVLGGDFSDYIVAMAPTVEFALTQQGDTAFTNDQTWVRCILPCDGAPRHEASFVLMDAMIAS